VPTAVGAESPGDTSMPIARAVCAFTTTWNEMTDNRQVNRHFLLEALSPIAENEANHAFDLLEPQRIERECYFNPAIRRPVDLEYEPRGRELDQAEPEAPSEPVTVVRL
jgi:hypothetical protein